MPRSIMRSWTRRHWYVLMRWSKEFDSERNSATSAWYQLLSFLTAALMSVMRRHEVLVSTQPYSFRSLQYNCPMRYVHQYQFPGWLCCFDCHLSRRITPCVIAVFQSLLFLCRAHWPRYCCKTNWTERSCHHLCCCMVTVTLTRRDAVIEHDHHWISIELR